MRLLNHILVVQKKKIPVEQFFSTFLYNFIMEVVGRYDEYNDKLEGM
jgi:hypothetical protein